MKEQRQLVSFDWAMKRLLRQKANYVVLEGFLSELLSEDITIENFEDSESNKADEVDKYNCVDLLARDSKGHLILVEIQYDSEIDYFHRMLYGTSKLITDYLNAGQAYENVKKVISVNLIYFDLGQGKDYVYCGKTNFIGRHFQDNLTLSAKQKEHFDTQCVSDIYPEYHILKLNSFDDYAKDNLDEWIYTLKNGKVPESYKAKGLKEAKEVLDVVNMTEGERADYNRYIKAKHVQASVVTSSILRAEKAEADRIKAEAETKKAETDRIKAEAETKKAEADRIKAEAETKKAEEDRIKAEAETKKAEAETKKAEADRSKAEKDRIKAESDKEKMYSLLKSMGLSDDEIREKLK